METKYSRGGFLPGTHGLGMGDGSRLVRDLARLIARHLVPPSGKLPAGIAPADGPAVPQWLSPEAVGHARVAGALEQELRTGGVDVVALQAALEAMGQSVVALGSYEQRQRAVRVLLLEHQVQDRIRRLEAFVASHGHPFAIRELCDDPLLSAFVERAIEWCRPMGELSEDARVRLEQVGLLPVPMPLSRLKRLVRFAARVREWVGLWTEECRMTRGKHHSLAVVVSRIRRQRACGLVDPRVVRLLESLAFPFEAMSKERRMAMLKSHGTKNGEVLKRRAAELWTKTFERVRKKAEAQGHFRFKNGQRDAIWLRQQQRMYRKEKLPDERVQLLREAGFPFEPRPRGRPRRDAEPWGELQCCNRTELKSASLMDRAEAPLDYREV